MTPPATHYANRISRILLRHGFDNQFAFPIVDNSRIERLFSLIERLMPKPDALPEIDAPIFVIGLPRTGSTWLQSLLCAHPDLGYFTQWMHHFRSAIRGACAVAKVLNLDAEGERFIGDSVVNSLHSPSEGIAFWGEWLGHDPACLYHDDVRLRDLDRDTVKLIKHTMALALAQFPGGSRFFCKNPGFIAYAPLLAELFPDACFIHLVRDPRPTANSMLKLLQRCDDQLAGIRASGRPLSMNIGRFVPYPRLPRLAEYAGRFGVDDIRTTARLWRDSILYMMEHGKSLPRLMTVRFESILADPRKTVERILNYCGLPPFPSGHAGFESLCARTGQVGHVNAYSGYDLISAICRHTMGMMGYRPDENPGVLAEALEPRECFGELI